MAACADCTYWRRHTGDQARWMPRHGECMMIVDDWLIDDFMARPLNGKYAESPAGFETREDFGCVLFETTAEREKRQMEDEVLRALIVAKQLADVASDWNLEEVEIDDEMLDIYDVREIIERGLVRYQNRQERRTT